jgi:glycosyltransferase involved in cell wall biosynthesis
MMMLTGIAIACLVLASLPLVLTLFNRELILPPVPGPVPGLSVSVLVPARNEEDNIGAALDAILVNDSVELEVLVCDDDSSDRTAEIVRQRAREDTRVRLIRAPRPATRHFGKPTACQHLAEAATGDILLFVDADVRLSGDAIGAIATTLDRSDAALISGIPHQQTVTWSEKLIVPLMDFVLYGYLPVVLMRRLTSPAFGAACGQLIAVRRDAYDRVGGHITIAHHVHDGIALARLFRRHGFLTDLIDATSIASCRMYRNWRELLEGFAKNAHEGLGSRRGLVPWTLVLGFGQVLPALLLPFVLGMPVAGPALILAAAMAYLTRFLLALRLKHSWFGVIAHPVGTALLVGIQWYALIRRLLKRPPKWRGRELHVS